MENNIYNLPINMAMSLDTSSLTVKDISAEEFKADLRSRLSDVLIKEFYDVPQKQRFKETKDGFSFACPFCHDSATDYNKKRGHFILNGKYAGFFKCFNCGKYMKISNFFNTFDKPLALNDLAFLTTHVSESSRSYTQNSSTLTSNVINTDEISQYAVDREQLKSMLHLYEIDKNTTRDAWFYLVNRCQYDFNKFLYDPAGRWMLILNYITPDKIFGIQCRDMTGKRKAKYITMSLSKMRQKILNDFSEIPEQVESLSTVFNIFNVDLYRPVLVTEGPFDAFLLPNCIATSGASKSLGIELPFWYVYDSDTTGLEHAIEKLKQGNNVFLWSKFKKQYNLPHRKKWDITDVMVWFRETNMKDKIYWSQFFTSSTLDILSL